LPGFELPGLRIHGPCFSQERRAAIAIHSDLRHITKDDKMTKRTYETPALIKREKLDRIAAACIGSDCGPQ